jgi:hypothetical protein
MEDLVKGRKSASFMPGGAIEILKETMTCELFAGTYGP